MDNDDTASRTTRAKSSELLSIVLGTFAPAEFQGASKMED